MQSKRRPLWFWLGSAYAAGVLALAAGLMAGTRYFGLEG